jgi:hypothetical protein
MKLAEIVYFIPSVHVSYSYIMSYALVLLCVGYIMMINWKNCPPQSKTLHEPCEIAGYIGFLSLLAHLLTLT